MDQMRFPAKNEDLLGEKNKQVSYFTRNAQCVV